MTNVYEFLAAEYYDPLRHPTCANFRTASKAILDVWLDQLSSAGDLCEIGCGMSVFAELLDERGSSLKQLYLVDSAPSMLKYSAGWVGRGAHLMLADAADLPFKNNAVDLCVSSLGDPYNGPAHWEEIRRILEPRGYAMYTTPSHEWASLFRGGAEIGADPDTAEFALLNGETVLAPSTILPEKTQIERIQNGTNLKVADVSSFRFSQLPPGVISGKLKVAKDADLPIVTGYLVQKLP